MIITYVLWLPVVVYIYWQCRTCRQYGLILRFYIITARRMTLSDVLK